MAFNLMRSFQVLTSAAERGRSRKRRTIFALETIQTLRYKWLNRAGTLVCPHGRLTLDVGTTADIQEGFDLMAQRLPRAA